MNRDQLIEVLCANSTTAIADMSGRRNRLARLSERKLIREAALRGLVDDDTCDRRVWSVDDDDSDYPDVAAWLGQRQRCPEFE